MQQLRSLTNVVKTWHSNAENENTKVLHTIGKMVGLEEVIKHSSDLDLNDIEIKKKKISKVKKEALRLKNYIYFPPWDSN